ncbi:MAG: pectin acetylesterase-family hydrolase [Polyangiales bacterium]
MSRALFSLFAALLFACGAPSIVGRDASTDRANVGGDSAPDVQEPPFEDVFFAPSDASADVGADSMDPGPQPPAEPPVGAPVVPNGQAWQWVPVPEARCMNGTPTGFGVNFSRGSNRLLIVLEGGGACFDAATCAVGTLHADGFNEATFRTVLVALGSGGTFNRAANNNPFASWNYVFIPYCSGDIHGGDVERSAVTGRAHLGYRNMGQFLARIRATFPSLGSVVIAGSSAGGFGAAWNYDRTARVFAPTPVHLLDDSGPIFSSTYLKPCLMNQFRAAWNLTNTMPAGCVACRAPDASMLETLRFVLRRYPDRRFGLISSDWDEVIRTFMSYGYNPSCNAPGIFPPGDFTTALLELRTNIGGEFATFKTFMIPGNVHTWLMTDLQFATRIDGVSLAEWSGQLAYGDAQWRDIGR